MKVEVGVVFIRILFMVLVGYCFGVRWIDGWMDGWMGGGSSVIVWVVLQSQERGDELLI